METCNYMVWGLCASIAVSSDTSNSTNTRVDYFWGIWARIGSCWGDLTINFLSQLKRRPFAWYFPFQPWQSMMNRRVRFLLNCGTGDEHDGRPGGWKACYVAIAFTVHTLLQESLLQQELMVNECVFSLTWSKAHLWKFGQDWVLSSCLSWVWILPSYCSWHDLGSHSSNVAEAILKLPTCSNDHNFWWITLLCQITFRALIILAHEGFEWV